MRSLFNTLSGTFIHYDNQPIPKKSRNSHFGKINSKVSDSYPLTSDADILKAVSFWYWVTSLGIYTNIGVNKPTDNLTNANIFNSQSFSSGVPVWGSFK